MNIYSQKQRWKYFLAIVALLIVIGTIWYASHIANKVQREERQKIKLWSQAIRKKAALVKLTNQSFSALAEKERENVKLWARAEKEFEKPLTDYGFALSIIQKNVDTIYTNDNIPLILTDQNDRFVSFVNVPIVEDLERKIKQAKINNQPNKASDYIVEKKKLIDSLIGEWSSINNPIEISYLESKRQRVYYSNSKEFYDLQYKRDSLIQSFNDDLANNTALVPVIFLNANSQELIATNYQTKNLNSSIAQMQQENDPIEIDLGGGNIGTIYYFESLTLKQLRYFPFVMLGVIGLFLVVAYLLFSTFRRAEQNQVWVGMAKETAHQLGTPLSSLMAWLEILKDKGIDENSISEMNKDIIRLETITERFSKIGASSKLEKLDVVQVVSSGVTYLKARISKKIKIVYINNDQSFFANINKALFEWVIENLIKNAVDAMHGEGELTLRFGEHDKNIFIDFIDTGKGVPSTKLKNVFEPGYTTKERGWGLGLSLAKRIIQEHHGGKIFIHGSEINKGTTFRIILPKV
ncbi:MAG: hypothetical protein CMD01_01555 [Flavobacteriales bacterium]|nr:hypothetical protein [Flavobacteriales bacterium]